MNYIPKDDDSEFISDMIEGLQESISFFNADNKIERERWVAREFIKNLNFNFAENEIISPSEDPPDIIFRGAEFEIKEILDPGRKRHKEYKDKLKTAQIAKQASELLSEFAPKDLAYNEFIKLCVSKLHEINHHYSNQVKSNCDLLFYVNLKHVFEIKNLPQKTTLNLEKYGWRSVSFIKGNVSCCVYANNNAPDWLRAIDGNIIHKSKQE